MKIGIICAISRELAPIASMLEHHKTQLLLQRTFHTGQLHGQEIVAVIGGVGKVNGALTAQLLAEHFGVDRLIFTGVAGGLDSSLHVGDVVIGTTVLYHDLAMELVNNGVFDAPADGFHSDPELVELCRSGGISLHYGTIVTGDQFIMGSARDSIIERFHPLCVDMESAAVAQVCWFYRLPLLIIRAITDFADDSADDSFEQNALFGGQKSLEVLDRVLMRLGK
ncbi:MAG: 5'-methylthioadenosine/adenosylhomocysteine nucleosidase [Angelakisella sp.]